MRVVCLLFSDSKNILKIAEACYRFTPQIAVRENEAIFLEIESCKRLYSESSLLLRLKSLLKRFNTQAKISVADNPWMSLALARFQEPLPIEALFDIASPFERREEIYKRIANQIKELKRLGLKDLSDFTKLSSKGIASRFQKEGLEWHKRLNTKSKDDTIGLWPKFVPEEKIIEDLNLEDHEHSNTIEPLLFMIKSAIGRAMARLTARGLRLATCKLTLHLEKYSTVKVSERSWVFNLPLSQGTMTGLLPIIRERFSYDLTREPLESATVKLSFEVLETIPGQYFQKHFFNKKEEEQEAWNSLITRLCEKLGRAYTKEGGETPLPAFVAEPIENFKPEKAWRRKIVEQSDLDQKLTGIDLPLPERPLRILQKPLELIKQENRLIPTDSSKKEWEITDWEGPERLSGEWWGEEFKRDYFRIGTKTGEQLWVFTSVGQVYLHGYFD